MTATSVAAFTATLDNTVVAVALRDMQADLGAGVTGLQAVVTAYTVAMAALLLAGGGLVDVLGARRVLLLGLGLFAGASAGCAESDGIAALVTWRAVEGAGAALLLPAGLALLSATAGHEQQRRRRIAAWAAVGGLALVAGPALGGELVAWRGWPWVFWVNLPLCAVAAVLTLLSPAPAATRARRLDVPGGGLSCLVLGLGAAGIVLAGHGSRLVMSLCLLAAAGALTVLVVVERRARDPLVPAGLLRDRRMAGALLGTLAAAVALFIALVFVALFLQLVQGQEPQAAGRLLLALPVALVLVAAATSRVRGTVLPVLLGMAMAGGALIALGARLRSDTSATELRLLLALLGAGIGAATAPLVAAGLAAASGRQGLAAGSISTARELGGVVAVGGLGSVAVARLSSRLGETLAAGGVSSQDRPALVDALLGARTGEVTRLLLDDVGIAGALRIGPQLRAEAVTSLVASTQLVLVLGGVLVVLAGALCSWLLRSPPAVSSGS
jgi:DHA2 family methylenomycin A resistance protein-like MFS transporter